MNAVLLHIGPVDAAAAEGWTGHMLANLALLRTRLDKLPFRLPPEIVDELSDLLRQWNDHAREAIEDGNAPFVWEADLEEDDLHRLVQYWANLDSLPDEIIDRLGVTKPPFATKLFFDALAAGVAEALRDEATNEPDPFAELLVEHGKQRRRARRALM